MLGNGSVEPFRHEIVRMSLRHTRHCVIHHIAMVFVERFCLKIESADHGEIAAKLSCFLLGLLDQRGSNSLTAVCFLHPQIENRRCFPCIDSQNTPSEKASFFICDFIHEFFFLGSLFGRSDGIKHPAGLFFNQFSVFFRTRHHIIE